MTREHGYYCLYGLILFTCLGMAVRSALPPAAPADSIQTAAITSQAPAAPLPEGIAPGLGELACDPCVYAWDRLLAGKLMLIDDAHPLPAEVPAPNTLAVAGGGAAAVPHQRLGIGAGRMGSHAGAGVGAVAQRIAQLEDEISQLEGQMADPANAMDYQLLARLGEEVHEKKSVLDEVYLEWAELDE